MSLNLWEGGTLKATCTFTPAGSTTPTDPTTVVAKLSAPDGTVTTYTYGSSAELTKTSTGVYLLTVTLNAAGLWWVRFTGTGAVKAAEDEAVLVKDSVFV